MPSAVEPSPDPASHVPLAGLDTRPTTPPAGLEVRPRSFLWRMLLRRHHYPCNAPRRIRHHNRRGTMKTMYATSPTLSITPRVLFLVPPIRVLVFHIQDQLDNPHTTSRLYFSNPGTHRLPSEPGCNSSYSYSSATWARSVLSSVTKIYMTSFDA